MIKMKEQMTREKLDARMKEIDSLTREIGNRVFTLFFMIRTELQPQFKEEVNQYEAANKKPFGLRISARRRWQRGVDAIREKYRSHELVQELYRLQDSCPHRFGGWTPSSRAILETSRDCLYCRIIEYKGLDESDPIYRKRERFFDDRKRDLF